MCGFWHSSRPTHWLQVILVMVAAVEMSGQGTIDNLSFGKWEMLEIETHFM